MNDLHCTNQDIHLIYNSFKDDDIVKFKVLCISGKMLNIL